jgi:hypothetical protein
MLARVLGGVIVVLVLSAPSAWADPITVQLTPTGLGLSGEQNVGFTFAVNEFLTLTAITKRGQACCLAGVPGTIYITSDGAGVQSDEAGKDGGYKGSKPISGVGPHALESLVLNFTVPVDPTSIQILLGLYDPSKDDAHLTVALNAGGTTILLPDLVEWLFGGSAPSSSELLIDFSDPILAALLSGLGPITSIEIRSLGDHYVVNTVTFAPVPEPTSLLLLGSGLVGLKWASRRRRRRRKSVT